MIKALIFDWHGVLDNTSFSKISDQLAQLAHFTKEEIYSELRSKKEEYILGNIAPDEFWNYISKNLNISQELLDPIKKYSREIQLNKALWKILPRLNEQYRLAILSDCPPDKTAAIRSTINLSLFAYTGFSSDEKKSKTTFQDEFFHKTITLLHVPSEDILYIDDGEKHIKLAEKYGLQGFLFTNAEQLLTHIQSINHV